MALTSEERRVLGIALGNSTIGDSVADKIDSGGNPVAANVPAIQPTVDLTALVVTPTTLSAVATGGTPDCDAAAVDAVFAEVVTALDAKADNADVETLRSEIEGRLDDIEAKLDAILSSLKTAGIMASS